MASPFGKRTVVSPRSALTGVGQLFTTFITLGSKQKKMRTRTIIHKSFISVRRGAGVADRAGLENRCDRKITEGSNPSLSVLSFCADKFRFARNGRTFQPFRVCGPFVPFLAILCVILLRLVLRLRCAVFCAACR